MRRQNGMSFAEFPMHDAEGMEVAAGRVTVKLLSHGWGSSETTRVSF
jgi:hypothetical protein